MAIDPKKAASAAEQEAKSKKETESSAKKIAKSAKETESSAKKIAKSAKETSISAEQEAKSKKEIAESTKQEAKSKKEIAESTKQEAKFKKETVEFTKEETESIEDGTAAAERKAAAEGDEVKSKKEKVEKEKLNVDLQKETESIGKKISKSLQKQTYSSKDTFMLNRKILGIKKLDLNYGKTYIEHQQKGLSSIQGILSTSKALNQSDDARKEMISDMVNDMNSMTSGMVDQQGYGIIIRKTRAQIRDLDKEAAYYESIGHESQAQAAKDAADIARETNATAKAGKKYLNITKKAEEITGFLKEQWKKIVAFMSIAALAKKIWSTLKKLALGFAEHIDKIGASFGVAGLRSEKLKTTLGEGHVEAIGIGKSMEDLIPIINTLSSEFGISFEKSADLANAILDSSVAMGLSADEGARLYGTLMSIGRLSYKQAELFAEATYQLAVANDVAPQAVMKDIAENAEVYAKFAHKGGINIGEAAIQAKKLGLGLSDVSGIAEGLLDFQSSLAAEMEASLMIGRQINLQKAREFALTGSLSKMMDEVLNQLGGQAEWNNLHYYQRKAMAKALGVDVAVMSKLVDKQGELAKQENFVDLIGKDAMSNLTRSLALIKSLGATLIQHVGPAIEMAVGKFKDWLENRGGLDAMKGIVEGIGDGLISIVEWFGEMFSTTEEGGPDLIKLLEKIKDIAANIGNAMKWVVDNAQTILTIMGVLKGAAIGASIGGAPGAAVGAVFGGGSAYLAAGTLNDYIWRPGEKPQKFDAQDTVIGFKEPLPEISKFGIQETFELEIPEIPKLEIPEISKLGIPEIPKLGIQEIPKLEIPEISKLEIPEISKLEIPEISKFGIQEIPKLEIPEIPKLEIPEISKFGIQEIPKLEIPEISKLGIQEIPKLEIPGSLYKLISLISKLGIQEIPKLEIPKSSEFRVQDNLAVNVTPTNVNIKGVREEFVAAQIETAQISEKNKEERSGASSEQVEGKHDFEMKNKLKDIGSGIGKPTNGQTLNEKLDKLISNMEGYFGHAGLVYRKGMKVV